MRLLAIALSLCIGVAAAQALPGPPGGPPGPPGGPPGPPGGPPGVGPAPAPSISSGVPAALAVGGVLLATNFLARRRRS
jgi:hypothetical protein